MSALLDESLFASLTPPTLLGGACTVCAAVVFPAPTPGAGCPRCGGSAMAPTPLPTAGQVWSVTRQTFAPKAPFVAPADGFEPFHLGYVDLGTVLVQTRFTGPVAIGDPVTLVLADLDENTRTYAFERSTR